MTAAVTAIVGGAFHKFCNTLRRALSQARLASAVEGHLNISAPASGQIFVQKDALYSVVHAVSKHAVANARNDRVGGKPQGVFDGGAGAVAAGR